MNEDLKPQNNQPIDHHELTEKAKALEAKVKGLEADLSGTDAELRKKEEELETSERILGIRSATLQGFLEEDRSLIGKSLEFAGIILNKAIGVEGHEKQAALIACEAFQGLTYADAVPSDFRDLIIGEWRGLGYIPDVDGVIEDVIGTIHAAKVSAEGAMECADSAMASLDQAIQELNAITE